MRETYTEVKDGITVTVWMISYDLWAFRASRDQFMTHGNLTACNRIDAWKEAFQQAEPEIWAAERAALYGIKE